jgi:RND superfamily putative drug exporter
MHRHRVAVLVAWAVLTIGGAVLGGSVFDLAESPESVRSDAESARVEQRLDDLDPEGEEIIAVLTGRDWTTVDLVDQASRVLYEIREIPGVVEVRDPYTSGASEQVADSGQGVVVVVGLDPGLEDDEALAVSDEVAATLRTIEVPTVLVGGGLLAEQAFADQAIADAARGEGIALVVLLLVLVVLLGGWVVGSIPVATALGAVAGSLLALGGLVRLAPVSEYAVNVVTLLGLGLAVDYTLLVLGRFREERARSVNQKRPDLAATLGRTLDAAGRTVLVSGLTVGATLSGLLVLGDPVMSGMALGGVVAVAVATVAGLTLAPALLAVGQAHVPAPGGGRWGVARRPPERTLLPRAAGLAQRRPRTVLALSVGLLLALAAPLLTLDARASDARALPGDSEPRLVHEAIQRDHERLRTTPIAVLAEPGPDDPRVLDLVERVRALKGVEDVIVLPRLADGSTHLAVEPAGATDGPTAQRLVREVRGFEADVPVLVGGPAAELVDAKDSTTSRLPLALLFVAVVTGGLLLWLTGSLVIPVKTLVLNLLSLAATLGVVVAIFQWGWGDSLLGFSSWGSLDLTTPLLLFMFAFGLSMDYHVFLVSRIKEAWDHPARGRSAPLPGSREANDRAVLIGITASGPVVTLAALAITVVFLGFAAGKLVAVKEIGVGMTVAVLLDVTVVRGLLLPAAMTLLGQWNWWSPSWLVGSRRGR